MSPVQVSADWNVTQADLRAAVDGRTGFQIVRVSIRASVRVSPTDATEAVQARIPVTISPWTSVSR